MVLKKQNMIITYCKSLFKRNFIFMPFKVAFNRPINNHIYETA